MGKRNVFRCDCGVRLHVRQIVKNGVTACPACKRPLPKKTIMQCYYHRRERKIRMKCVCGKRSAFPLPKETETRSCPRCGKQLLAVRAKTVGGVTLPRCIEIN